MRIDGDADTPDGADPGGVRDLKEIVMGLHWSPSEDGAISDRANLDALCALLDRQQRVLEVVSPAHPRDTNGSVIHTGDSREGASEWDDERIFVFLGALPEAVSSLAFIVTSVTGRAFSEVRGASCHISDHITDHEWIRLQLTDLGQRTVHCVATLQRGPTGWKLSTDAHAMNAEVMAQLLLLIGGGQGSVV